MHLIYIYWDACMYLYLCTYTVGNEILRTVWTHEKHLTPFSIIHTKWDFCPIAGKHGSTTSHQTKSASHKLVKWRISANGMGGELGTNSERSMTSQWKKKHQQCVTQNWKKPFCTQIKRNMIIWLSCNFRELKFLTWWLVLEWMTARKQRKHSYRANVTGQQTRHTTDKIWKVFTKRTPRQKERARSSRVGWRWAMRAHFRAIWHGNITISLELLDCAINQIIMSTKNLGSSFAFESRESTQSEMNYSEREKELDRLFQDASMKPIGVDAILRYSAA